MVKQIEYVCSYCGKKSVRSETMGRPAPGQCPRKGKTLDGRSKPHTWVKNRTLGG
jgi:DNA-directed RNA polymerase subunit RPC12/RpoP